LAEKLPNGLVCANISQDKRWFITGAKDFVSPKVLLGGNYAIVYGGVVG